MRVLRGVVARSFLVVGFATVIFAFAGNSQAVENTWINHPGIKFTKVDEFEGTSRKPTTLWGNNIDCSKTLMMIKPPVVRVLLPDAPPVYIEQCAVSTTYGLVGGYYLKPGTDVAGRADFWGKQSFIPSPNMSNAIIASPSAVTGVYLGILENVISNIETTVQTDKTVKHTLRNDALIKNITSANGTRLQAMPETVAFSSNGKWMVFDSSNHGLVRADTTHGKTLSFGLPTAYGGGQNPGNNLAISADGRYVISSRVNQFIIYDLNSCATQTGRYSHLMNCSSRSLNDQRVNDTKFGFAAHLVRFTSQDSFTYYDSQIVNNVVITRKYRVTMGDVPEFGYQYLGLGDSFASGEGAFSYKTTTQDKCHTSLRSYPFLLGEDLSKEDYESIACSGATTVDIYNDSPRIYKGQVNDGIFESNRDAQSIISIFLPGYIRQNTFLENLKPEAVTISIGGNDLAFSDKITACVMPGICFNTLEDRKQVAEEIYELSETLVPTYQKLKEDNRRVYVVGYPKIVQPNGACAVNVQLNASEIAFADKLTVLINDVIEFAADQAGVMYVDVENILGGRKLCETDSDNALVNGISENHTKQGLQIAKESFHPKIDAHVLYKDAINQQTNGLSKPMPQRNNPAFFPRLLPSDEFFRELGSSGRTIYKPIYEDIKDIVFTGEKLKIDLDSNFTGLGAQAQVKAELHSTPVDLGTFTTDSSGNLSAEVTIPENVEPGYHSIHFYGTSQTGQNIDVYDYFFVGASATDFDGDGTLDEDEGCIYINPVGTDTDQDGIDDACDGVVDPLPEPEIVPEPEPEIIPDLIVEEEPELQPAENPTEITDPVDIIVEPRSEVEPIDILIEPPIEELPPEDETPTEDEVIDLPVINPIEPPKDIDGNGETVAGNEDMATPQPEPLQPTTNSQTPAVVAVNTTRNTQNIVNEPQPELDPQVLSETAAVNGDAGQVTVPQSSVNDKPIDPVVKDSNVYKYYLLAGVVAFIGLVTFLLVALTRSRNKYKP